MVNETMTLTSKCNHTSRRTLHNNPEPKPRVVQTHTLNRNLCIHLTPNPTLNLNPQLSPDPGPYICTEDGEGPTPGSTPRMDTSPVSTPRAAIGGDTTPRATIGGDAVGHGGYPVTVTEASPIANLSDMMWVRLKHIAKQLKPPALALK